MSLPAFNDKDAWHRDCHRPTTGTPSRASEGNTGMMPTPLPTYAQLEPVGQCNLRCQMCSIQFRADGPPYGPPAFMPFERFVAMLDALQDLQELHLQGLGEPMMHPRFFDMVSYAAAKGIRVTTNSNATLLNDRRAERCVASGLACLHVSLDGANAATYERIRVRAHFDRVQHVWLVRRHPWCLRRRPRRGSART